MLIGYARVSKTDGSQSLDLQRDALRSDGVDAVNLYHDFASGLRDDRPGLDSCLRALREGDVLVVWKLDRLGRNLAHGIFPEPPGASPVRHIVGSAAEILKLPEPRCLQIDPRPFESLRRIQVVQLPQSVEDLTNVYRYRLYSFRQVLGGFAAGAGITCQE